MIDYLILIFLYLLGVLLAEYVYRKREFSGGHYVTLLSWFGVAILTLVLVNTIDKDDEDPWKHTTT